MICKKQPAMRLRHKRAWHRISAVLPSNAILRAAILLVTGAAVFSCTVVFAFILHMHIRWYIVNALADPSPVPIDGQLANFTLLVLTYSERLPLLYNFVRHYSQCASVSEILIIWNMGKAPNPSSFRSRVPVRVRVEARNSLNNRFEPDADIRTQAVLSLDDDIFMPCSDIEHGFAQWRQYPQALVGFHPRLAEGIPLQYTPEHNAVTRNRYNIILTGSAFLDHELYFPMYQQEAADTALVDELFNCEDILMNFVVANATRGSPAILFVRPQLRIDVSCTSGVPRLSGKSSRHRSKRDICLQQYAHSFGDTILQLHTPEWGARGTPRCGLARLVGCLFM